jgi:polyisoprenoid-binding protein YceI
MSTTMEQTALPTGTWQLDPVHSTIAFEVAYLGGTFRGGFREVAATLDGDAARITGSARPASVDVRDEHLAAHLRSPEFFDVERHPELSFVSTAVEQGADRIRVHGELTIKGITRPVELTGTVAEPVTDPYGRRRAGLVLSTAVDRRAYGLAWNVPLPSGEPALADDVVLRAELFFVEQV